MYGQRPRRRRVTSDLRFCELGEGRIGQLLRVPQDIDEDCRERLLARLYCGKQVEC
jgi:hypothetical protein